MGSWSSFGLILILGAAIALAGCVPAADNEQARKDEELRSIVASDRQQIDALQEQVARLNDQMAEMQHEDGGGGAAADKKQLAELEREIRELKSGSTAPAAAAGGPGTAVPPAANAGGSSAAAGPPTGSPNVPGATAAPPPEAAPTLSGTPGAIGAPGIAANAPNGAANANAESSADDNDDSADSEDNAPQVASNAPPPSAAAPAPAPPVVSGSPSWRGMLVPEIAAAQSSGDPAAKVYRAGLVNLKAGRYAQAVGTFQGLQRRYPKSTFSEPAEYFSANALYEMGKYDQAILGYSDLVMRFPRGRFASASLLSEAQTFMKTKDPIDARFTLEKLLNEHPSAPEAPTARAMMNSLANG